jgi:hypothetical protein
MKKNYLLKAASCLMLTGGLLSVAHGQTGIGTTTPDASAQLDVTATNKGVLVPRLTTVQRTGVAAPANGLLVYDSDTNSFWYFKTGTGWTELNNAPLVLPYSATENNAANLFSITNNGDGTSLVGTNNSTTSSISAVRGIVSSTSAGGFSAAVRGFNAGTGGLGIGVWGSQDGSGWGVYGTTPNGLGVYGNSSAAGYGVYANSNTGTGLFATSNNGPAAGASIFNNANNNTVFAASTVGQGSVITATTTGNGAGVLATTGNGFAIHGIASATVSAGVIGDNTGGGEAVVGRNTSDIAGAVVGRNDGGGYGVRGFVATNTTGTGIGVLGQIGLNGSTGRAGRFENFNATNIAGNGTLEVHTVGNGDVGDYHNGNGLSSIVNNTNSVAGAIRGQVNTIFGNFGAAAVMGEAAGTGGAAGLFFQSNAAGNGTALISITDGNGDAIRGNAGGTGDGMEANVEGNGRAVYGWVPTFGTGRAAEFRIFNDANNNPVVTSKTVGNANAGEFEVDNTNGTSAGVKGTVNSIFSNFGTSAVYGRNDGTGGTAGLFYNSSATTPRPAVIAITDGSGEGIVANAGGNGNGIETTADGTGASLFSWKPNFATGIAGRFTNYNTSNGNPTAFVENYGTGSALTVWHRGLSGNVAVFQSGSPSASNVARIDKTGKGFFNGGTQSSGADLAEAFDVMEELSAYEPGDVLSISSSKDRTVEKSAEPYSSMVLGVYATKPGVLLTEENIDSELKDKVPMGVVGVIPTKVCTEGGAIKRGDLLVTSSIPGVAMKADLKKVQTGQVIGKALQNFDESNVGKINVFVNIK